MISKLDKLIKSKFSVASSLFIFWVCYLDIRDIAGACFFLPGFKC